MLKLFDKTVWLWRMLDPVLPWPGLTLVMVARKPAAPSGSSTVTVAELRQTPVPAAQE
jgi:hypothetical protein